MVLSWPEIYVLLQLEYVYVSIVFWGNIQLDLLIKLHYGTASPFSNVRVDE